MHIVIVNAGSGKVVFKVISYLYIVLQRIRDFFILEAEKA